MYTKKIIFTETMNGPMDLKTQARDFIAEYALRKYSFFLENTFNHKGLWNHEKGLYISYFRAEEQPHEAIAERFIGKENKQNWCGLSIKIATLKDNQKILQIHSYSEGKHPGTTPGIPRAQEKQFINDVITNFDNIPSLNSIRI